MSTRADDLEDVLRQWWSGRYDYNLTRLEGDIAAVLELFSTEQAAADAHARAATADLEVRRARENFQAVTNHEED